VTEEVKCEVCGADIYKDPTRCTNGRCAACHRKHCTPGGATSPGHGRGTVKVRTKFTAEQIEEGRRLLMYFPYRIVTIALSPAGEFRALAHPTMRQANKLVREGWTVAKVETTK
jgi:hypothetical protein